MARTMTRSTRVSAAAGRKAHRVRRRTEAARGTPAKPSPRQLAYLRAIGTRSRTTIDLAGMLDVTERSAREMIHRLEGAGWVEALPMIRRRRKIHILTPSGVMVCLIEGVRAFADEMREQQIHIGIGNPPSCVVCAVPWPCAAAGPAPEPPCLGDPAEVTDRPLGSP